MKFAFSARMAARLCLGFVLGAAMSHPALAASASASPWIESANSKARLVAGTVDLDGKPTLVAGVQLRMNSGWKTYWKNPGDSGVPPSFDWSGSTNLKHAELLYPAPHRFTEANGWAIGYDDEIVFPVKITPEREGEPVELKLVFDYGLCKDLCIPNDVTLGLKVGPDIGKGDARLIETFLARVPKAGAPGMLPEVSGVEASFDGEAPKLVVYAIFPAGATATDLFIDAGDVFVPMPKALDPPEDGKQRFAVNFVSASEAAAIKGKPMALTLVSDRGSTETIWTAE
jgi:DsbC/DsbD-like thiol-disulfide interchange protein